MTETGHLERRITGTPQGGIISPLLANIALSVLDNEFERRWAEGDRYPNYRQQLRRKGFATYRLIRFADDFVVMVKGTEAQAEAVMAELPGIVGRIGLTLSADKTNLTHIDDGFEFLGFRIVRKLRGNGKSFVYTFVSDEALAAVKRKVKALTTRSTTSLSLHQLIRALNPILRGWAAYYRFAASKRTFAYLGYYTWWRVIRWIRKKHPRMTWKQLKRRYGPLPGQPQENGMVLYNPATMRVIRYRYRGSKISTPWNDIDAKAPGHRRMAFDEVEFLGRMEESLVG